MIRRTREQELSDSSVETTQPKSTDAFFAELLKEDTEGVYRSQTRVAITPKIDTAIFVAHHDEEEPQLVRVTNLDTSAGAKLFDVEVFVGDERLHREHVDLAEGSAPTFDMMRPIDLDEDYRFSEEFRQLVSGARIRTSHPILVADLGDVKRITGGHEEVDTDRLHNRVQSIIHKSGNIFTFHRRKGRDDEGELANEPVLSIDVHQNDGSFETIVEREQDIVVEARAGNRAIIKKVAIGAGAAAIISAGVVGSIFAAKHRK